MPLIIPPGFMQMVWEFTITGDAEVMVCTCGFDVSDAAGDQEHIVAWLATTWADNVLQWQSSALHLVGGVGYFGQDGADNIVVVGPVLNDAGGSSANSLPPNCAVLARKRTDLGGRRGRGRVYVPGIAEGEVGPEGNNSNAQLAGFQGAFDDMMTAWSTDVTDGPVTPVVLHKSEGIGPEPVPTPIVLWEVERKIATQRRRLRP